MRKLQQLLLLFWTFFKIGLFTFGGGYAMIPLIESEVTLKHRWLTEKETLDLFIIAESTPGPVSVNSATYVGYKVAGLLGAFFATLGLALPSLLIIIVIALFYDQFMTLSWVQAAFYGIQAGVSILIIAAAIKLSHHLERNFYNIIALLVVVGLQIYLSTVDFTISTIYFIITGFVLGIVFYGLNNIKKGGSSK